MPAASALKLVVAITGLPFDADAPALGALGALEVSVVEPAGLLAAGAGAAQQATVVPASACTAPAGGGLTCSVTLEGVNVAGFSQGLAVQLRDARAAAASPGWATVYSFTGADALAAAMAGSRTLAATPVSLSALDAVAAWAGVAAADLFAHGAVIGTLTATAGATTPLAGASIKPSQTGLTIGYGAPGGGPAVPTSGPSTALGMFVATPAAARTLMTADWRINMPAGAGVSKTASPAFGATGGVISVLGFSGP